MARHRNFAIGIQPSEFGPHHNVAASTTKMSLGYNETNMLVFRCFPLEVARCTGLIRLIEGVSACITRFYTADFTFLQIGFIEFSSLVAVFMTVFAVKP